ncbi:MAG: MBL fold metallo-hydrolase [Clostridiales bacterium]|nr:MBL fold metallo-hydrolase [Clostridiales bacterium]MDR2752220.1 MBL fold metallo-hydrolase [Clostridiales bacterium]
MRKYIVTKLDSDTFCIEQKFSSFRCLCYLLLGKDRALLVDTAIYDDGFEKAIKDLCSLPLDVAITHAHMDHIGNAHCFKDVHMSERDREVFRLHTDRAYLESMLDMTPMPARLIAKFIARPIFNTHPEVKTIGFQDGTVFDLGGRTVEVIETPGHSTGSVCFLEKGRSRLYSGDMVCDMGILLHLEGCESVTTFLESIRKLQALKGSFSEICTGHRQSRIDVGYLDEYEECAAGIISGKIAGKPQGKAKVGTHGRVSITYVDGRI